MMRVPYPGFPRLVALSLFLNLLGGQLLHEIGHWAVLQFAGHRPVWGFTSLIQLSDREPLSPARWVMVTGPNGDQSWLHLASLPQSDLEWSLFLAAGPLIQLAAVILGLMVARTARSHVPRTLALLLALINALMGTLYQIVSGLRGAGGDENLLGYYLGVSPQWIHLLFGLAFAVGLFGALSRLDSWALRGQWLAAVMVGAVAAGPLIGRAHRLVTQQVDRGHPFFDPLFGFSLPVLLTGLLALLALVLLTYQWHAVLALRDS